MEEEKIVLLDKNSKIRYAYVEDREIIREEKAKQLERLLMQLVKVSVAETVKEMEKVVKEECHLSENKIGEFLKEESKKREEQWKTLECHFENVDKILREKQKEGKRKKHSIF